MRFASGTEATFIAGLFFTTAGLTIAAILRGIFLLDRDRWVKGVRLILIGLAVPVFIFVAPSVLYRWEHGRGPLDHYPIEIKEGMSKAEVLKRLGKPHQVREYSGETQWIYDTDPVGFGWSAITYGPDDKVIGIGGD